MSSLNLGPPVGLHPESTSTSTFKIPFARNYGLTNLAGDQDLHYQPSTGTLSANVLDGQYSGTVNVTSSSENGTKYITFVDGPSSGSKNLFTGTSITINPGVGSIQMAIVNATSSMSTAAFETGTASVTDTLSVTNESTFGDAITVSVDGGNKVFLNAPNTNVASGDSNYMQVFNKNGAHFAAGCDGVGLTGFGNIHTAAGTINNGQFLLLSNNVVRCHVHQNGLQINGVTHSTGGYTESDDRLKHNEKPIEGALSTLKKLKPQIYDKTVEDKGEDFNGELEEGTYRKESGFIAQEVLQDVPELSFIVSPPSTDPDINPQKYYSVNYADLHAYEVSAIQELSQMVESLKEELKQIKDSLA